MKSAEKISPYWRMGSFFRLYFSQKGAGKTACFLMRSRPWAALLFCAPNVPLLFSGHSRASACCEERRKLLYFNLLNEHHLGRESIVQLEQKQTLSQKLVLTQTMRQSLDCLQLSAPELAEYVQEVALSNPLLDVQSPPITRPSSPARPLPPSVNRSRFARRTRGAASPPPVWRMCRTSPPF